MLGIPLSAPGGDLSKWFIPTYVGHTWADLLKFMSRTVHPHIRGAYHRARNGVAHVARFIPTYVGHTYTSASRSAAARGSSPPTWGHTAAGRSCAGSAPVHPHIRGAYTWYYGDGKHNYGSSPHTWGIQSQRLHGKIVVRFTPTYVGLTSVEELERLRDAVHPHIRGAYSRSEKPIPWQARFIPTYVGHTSM